MHYFPLRFRVYFQEYSNCSSVLEGSLLLQDIEVWLFYFTFYLFITLKRNFHIVSSASSERLLIGKVSMLLKTMTYIIIIIIFFFLVTPLTGHGTALGSVVAFQIV